MGINGKDPLEWINDSIKFRNYFKQLAASFRIYANFEYNVKNVKSSNGGDRGNNTSYTEKNQE